MRVVSASALWPTYAPGLHWGHIAGELMQLHGMMPSVTRPLLLGLRGVVLGAVETHRPVHRASYEDTFVLLRPDTTPYLFPGSTAAYQRNSKESPDTDGDGVGDVGSIRCGRYVLHLLPGQANGPTFHLRMPDGSDRIPAHRDFDHDGVISEQEARKSEDIRAGRQVNSDGCYATAVLFHVGYTSGRSSIACQTAHQKHLDELRSAGTALDYILADAWLVVPMAERAQALYGEPRPERTA